MADEEGTDHARSARSDDDGSSPGPVHDVDGPTDLDDPGAGSGRPAAWWSTPRARVAMGVGVVAVLVAVIAISVLRSGGELTTVEQAGADDRIVTDTAPPDTTATETSGPPAAAEEPPSTVGTTTTTRKPRRPGTGPPGPLTAQAVDYPGYERRGALVVKIDNLDSAARPQAGITLADVVYEERVEGNITRFAAVFHGSDSEAVGPIRSGRSTDLGIVGPLQRPLFAFSGANGSFLDLLRAGPLTDVGADVRPGAYYRAPDRGMPHNLFSSTGTLYAQAGAVAPTPLWPFRAPNTLPVGARPVVGASMQFGGGFTNVVYRWDPVEGGGAFVREQNGRVHYDTDNWPVAPQNVVIQLVDYVDSGVPDGSGNQIPEGRLVGSGSGWLLTGGAVVPIRWERSSLTEPTRYVGPDGQLVPFAPGKTWIELVPAWTGATFQYR